MQRGRRRITVAAPSVGPLGIAGCVLWLRADLGVTKDGSNLVSQWDDQSGNGNHMTASGGQRPEWVESGMGGRAMLRFDGSQRMVGADLSALTEGSIFIVFSMDADPPPGGVCWTLGGQASNVPYSDGNVYESAGRSAQINAGNFAPSFTAPRVYDVQSKAASYQINVDGSSQFATATVTPQFLGSNTIGQASGGIVGQIAEVVVYSTFFGVGTANYQHITRALGARYGIPVT